MNDQTAGNASLDEASDRPLVTFALFAYNQEKYIREAVEGALAQTYSPLEIILSDDGSTDRTFEIMQEMVEAYRGSHVVKLNKNSENLGLIDHVNRMFELANGELIVAAAGDDISLPTRTKRLVEFYQKTPAHFPLLVHSSVMKIDENNNDLGVWVPPVIAEKMDLEKMANSAMAGIYIGATGAWSRKLCQHYGPLKFKRAYEDLVFGFRAALTDSMLYVDEPLVRYRVSTGVTAKLIGFDGGVRDIIKLIRHRQRLNFAHIDVFKQRIDDIARFNGLLDKNIPILLENALSYELAKGLLYQSPLRALLGALTANDATKVKAVLSEARFMVDLGVDFVRFHIKKLLKKILMNNGK